MSRTITNIETGSAFTVPNTTTADNIVVWRNTTGTSLGESLVSVASQNISGANSLTLNEQAANPGSSNTLWLNNVSGHLYRGITDLEAVTGTVDGPASSVDNAIARFDGITGATIQGSGIIIDDVGNITSVKSIGLTSSVTNPGGPNSLWLDSTTGNLMLGAVDLEYTTFDGVSLTPAAINPGDETTLWVNSANGHLYRGDSTDIETFGTGDVVGPTSSTDNAITRFDGATGKLLQNSTVLVDDPGNMSAVRSISYTSVAANPGTTNTVWHNSANGHLYRGTTDLEATTGDVFGPASAIDNGVVRFDGSTGKLVQASASITIDDVGGINAIGSLSFNSFSVNPGSTNTLWRNSADSVLYHGANKLGNMIGPASSTDNGLIRFDGTTGKVLQGSLIVIDDTANVSNVKSLSITTSVSNPEVLPQKESWNFFTIRI